TMVERELARLAGEGGARAGDAADGGDDSGELSEPDQALARAWARDTSLLLAELSQRRAGAENAGPLPAAPSGAALATMAARAGAPRSPRGRAPARRFRAPGGAPRSTGGWSSGSGSSG